MVSSLSSCSPCFMLCIELVALGGSSCFSVTPSYREEEERRGEGGEGGEGDEKERRRKGGG